MTARLDEAIARVTSQGNCSGCGACTLLDDGLEMAIDAEGFARPTRVGPSTAATDADRRFNGMCPGVVVRAPRPASARRHPTMGTYLEAFEAWAVDPEIRYAGSSGGALTALSVWMLETGEAARAVSAIADSVEPRRTVALTLTTREEALAAAGSRYAPVAAASQAAVTLPDTVVIAKPCEASAVRALMGPDTPPILSFFCAGTPSQSATDGLVRTLGVADDDTVTALWYRGRGWPGRFTVEHDGGPTVSASYDESWGTALGPTVQWRCKICADGVGESADVTAADFWRADDRGYPDFTDGDGISALVARTPRGLDLVRRAIEAGVIAANPIGIESLAAVQPLQVARRTTLAGRLVGATAAGGRVPRYRGFSLARLASSRLRDTWRAAKGTFRRRRSWGSAS
jgi:coenzyme F420 hydrogenase subunit beta